VIPSAVVTGSGTGFTEKSTPVVSKEVTARCWGPQADVESIAHRKGQELAFEVVFRYPLIVLDHSTPLFLRT